MVPCGDGPNLYNISTNYTWTNTMDDVLPVQMMYAYESGNFMLRYPLLSEIKSQLTSSGIDENHIK